MIITNENTQNMTTNYTIIKKKTSPVILSDATDDPCPQTHEHKVHESRILTKFTENYETSGMYIKEKGCDELNQMHCEGDH